MGVDKYNAECRAIVMRYQSEWESIVKRFGRWIDFKNGYKTLGMTMPILNNLYRSWVHVKCVVGL